MRAMLTKQRGLTFISLAFLLSVGAFLLLLALKIGPIYLDHSKVMTALAAVKEVPDLENKTPVDIREMIRKRFDMNYVTDVNMDSVQINKSGSYLKVEMKYDVVKKVMGNLSVLVEFDDVVEVGGE